jgi:hypothetical protein
MCHTHVSIDANARKRLYRISPNHTSAPATDSVPLVCVRAYSPTTQERATQLNKLIPAFLSVFDGSDIKQITDTYVVTHMALTLSIQSLNVSGIASTLHW